MGKDTVIFDLDGTLANGDHRLHHIHGEKKDWRAYFAACGDDEPNTPIIRILRRLADDLRIWIVSGRSDEVRFETEQWLKKHKIQCDNIIMRKAGDYTQDHELKELWVKNGTIPVDRVLCVFDDRDRVVKMWRDNGFACLQVKEGDF